LLPRRFAHADHGEINCVKRRHDFADDTGEGLCVDCHKTNAKVAAEIELIFHTFCRSCHVDERAHGHDAGSVWRCSDCLVADEAP
jgi:hypothetical protein